MALDLSRDYLVIDDPITLSVRQKLDEGVWSSPYAVAYCQQEEVTKDDVARDRALEKDGSAFHLWKANLPTVNGTKLVPKIGDKIVYGATYNVRSVQMLDRDGDGIQRYRALCTKSQS